MWCQITEEGGVVISGRSDAVLNPGGVRIGTAEIYRQVRLGLQSVLHKRELTLLMIALGGSRALSDGFVLLQTHSVLVCLVSMRAATLTRDSEQQLACLLSRTSFSCACDARPSVVEFIDVVKLR